MREEIENWWNQAQKDLKAARNSLASEDYGWASFQAHQAVEKGLKALYIKKRKEIFKTHNLVSLARELVAPDEIVKLCGKINPSYIDTRYPDSSREYTKNDSLYVLNLAEEILKWIEKNL